MEEYKYYKQDLEKFEETHSYCNHCGIVFDKQEADGCCPYCILNEDLSYNEQHLIVLQRRRNKLNRQIATLKKAHLN
jgi:ribosomal protein S27AE